MTTQDKNIAIAKMIGWKIEGTYVIDWKNHPLLKSWEDVLKFDIDANWQFEAIEFVENLKNKQGYGNMVTIWCNGCCITENNAGFKIIDNLFRPTKKEAIFEVLYKFSQYLKK